jgi:hypothetical protein
MCYFESTLWCVVGIFWLAVNWLLGYNVSTFQSKLWHPSCLVMAVIAGPHASVVWYLTDVRCNCASGCSAVGDRCRVAVPTVPQIHCYVACLTTITSRLWRMNVKHWWNESDGWNPRTRRRPCLTANCPPQIQHELAWNQPGPLWCMVGDWPPGP